MPKSKKTRKQKILSDLRQKKASVPQVLVPSEEVSSVSSYVHSASPVSVKSTSHPTILTETYAYLSHDLRKTFFLTTAIVLVELLLHYFLR